MKTAASRPVFIPRSAFRLPRFLAAAFMAIAGPAFGGDLPPVDFAHDVLPLMSRFGCNASACHGKAEGQNGFKLSVFGTDPKLDREAIATQSRGRRIMPAAPHESLLLRKASAQVPHAGGRRMKPGSPEYAILRDWVAGGSPYAIEGRSEVTELRVEPAQMIMGFRQSQPLRVLAAFSDGTERDVTWLALFHSNNNAIAEVDETGAVTTGSSAGQAAIMARYLGRIAVFQATVPRAGPPVTATSGAGFNVIDHHVAANLRRMNLQSSALADDAAFLRRVSLDVIGRLPSPAEARRFLASTEPDKRERLVDSLLDLPEYADFWALKWADLLRVDRLALGHREARAYYDWVHSAVAANKPLDSFARELLLAEGPLAEQPAGEFYKVAKKSGEMAAAVSQVFLGIRITCAECHQHPYDRWTQRDYHGMRAFFEQVSFKKVGAAEALVVEGDPKIQHPRTKENINAYPLGAEMPETAPQGDRRAALARWMTAPENPWFARNMANRFWAHFFGRGIVEPVDDVRATNPPSNPGLLDALTAHLVGARFDARALIRFIAGSRTYQLSSAPNDTNRDDSQNFSRALFRRLPAEALLDAVCDVTGVPEKFTGSPAGTRAVELWDSNQQHYFLKLFGRPARATACDCERSTGASISQALHLMNSPNLQNKLAHEAGRIAQLAAQADDQRIVEELWLACFSRLPDAAEKAYAAGHLASRSTQRRKALEDLAWSLMNSLEFTFNH
jgi:hypothetical protein